MLAFLRRNTVAFIALFIALGGTAYAANTVRSTDIVDGQVKTQDLADHAVTARKLGISHGFQSSTQSTDQCDTPGLWTACAPVTMTVPAGHFYRVLVTSVVHGDAGGTGNVHALMCAASAGPTCIDDGGPDYVTFFARGVTHGIDVQYSGAGAPAGSSETVTFSTAVKFGTSLIVDAGARTTTTVEYWDE